MSRKANAGDFLFGLFIFVFFQISSWLCSIPTWLTLVLHFVLGLPLFWFWLTLTIWLLAGLLRYLLLYFAARCGNTSEPKRENKNPYSMKKKIE